MAQLFLAAAILLPADASRGCRITVKGGKFTCHAIRNGGFLFASDGGWVKITGGLVSNNVAKRKGGAVSSSRPLAVVRTTWNFVALNR